MPTARLTLCRFCGAPLATAPKASGSSLCPVCEALAHSRLTLENGAHGAREVMINQHAGEPRRKLLELAAHSIVVFLSPEFEVLALEIETKGGDRVLRWAHTAGRAEYAVQNLGRSYGNRDEMIPEHGFDRERLRRDVAASRANLRPGVLAALERALGD